MSAYVVTDGHLDVLVDGLLNRWRNLHAVPWEFWREWDDGLPEAVTARGAANAVGQLLHVENVRSVNHRYNETEAPRIYVARPAATDALAAAAGCDPAVVILKAWACFEYQACEHPGWEGSRAEALAARGRAMAIRNLPGYAEAPWAIP